MLIIAGRFDVDPADVDAFMEAAKPMMAASRAEDGCHAYTFYVDPLEPRQVWIYERWESQAHLEAHFEAPHMATFQAAIANLGREVIEITKWSDIGDGGPVR